MASNTLFDRCHVNTNIENDVFVGIQKKDDYYEVDFPLGYHLSSDEKGLRKDILSLLNVLSRYIDKRQSELYDGLKNEDSSGIPIQAYLFLIKDFFERGYYRERETLYKVSKKGKINWRKTIKTQKPVMQGHEAFYLNFVVKKNTINEDELITLVHKYCVYESFEKFGWLFTSFVPNKPKTGLTVKMMLTVVNNKLQNTFKDQNKQLFKNMLAVLKQLHDDAQMEFKYGTYRFEYVWEKMIDKVFGISEKVDYFPKTTWNIWGNKKHDNAFLEPDSIMLHDGKVYVLDAKYYKYGWSGAPRHLPESTSINKQITYGEYIAKAERFVSGGSHPVVYNAFIMPYDSNGKMFPTNTPIYYIGTATSDWKYGTEKYENVVGILMDVKYLMGIDSRLDESQIMALAALIEEKCSV
ncbi:MAG: LlaJI family restriction endonuclease [Lachnospiraceae bacterium]|nr:LlaJI family restriction endonuclease [Lachnospiraceae bacterium]